MSPFSLRSSTPPVGGTRVCSVRCRCALLDEARILADAVIADAGLQRTAWAQSGPANWRYCTVPLPCAYVQLRIGISSGGVVAIDGVPFLDCAKLCVNFDTVTQAFHQAAERKAWSTPLRIAVGHHRTDRVENGRLRWIPVDDLEMASSVFRGYIERNALAPNEVAGGEVWSHAGGKRALIGIVKYNGRIWSGDNTRLVWEPEGWGVSVPPAARAPAMG
jgi:uncharacterized metal-binding protein